MNIFILCIYLVAMMMTSMSSIQIANASLLRLNEFPINIISSSTSTTSTAKDSKDDKTLIASATINLQKAIDKVRNQPFSHHSKEYLFEEFEFHVAQPLFASFGKVLNPILERVVHEYVEAVSKDESDFDLDLSPVLHVSHHMLEMRDGIKLSTFVVVPQHAYDGKKKVPTMFSRSPYGKLYLYYAYICLYAFFDCFSDIANQLVFEHFLTVAFNDNLQKNNKHD